METNKTISDILRWIFFIPLTVAIYFLAKISVSYSFYFISSSLVTEISKSYDFGGNYLFGILFILISDVFSTGFCIYAGVCLAPRYKKIVFAILLFVFLFPIFLGLLIGNSLFFQGLETTEEIVRAITSSLATIIGIILAGILIWKQLLKNCHHTQRDALSFSAIMNNPIVKILRLLILFPLSFIVIHLIYVALDYFFVWFMDLSKFWFIVALIFFVAFIQRLLTIFTYFLVISANYISPAKGLGMWIIMILASANGGSFIYNLWTLKDSSGFWDIFTTIVATLFVVNFLSRLFIVVLEQKQTHDIINSREPITDEEQL